MESYSQDYAKYRSYDHLTPLGQRQNSYKTSGGSASFEPPGSVSLGSIELPFPANTSRRAENMYGRGEAYGWSLGEKGVPSKSDRPWERNSPRNGKDKSEPAEEDDIDHETKPEVVLPSSGPTAKRGSKACVACRKGKNRCEWDPSAKNTTCRRCMLNGTKCVFEKASEKSRGKSATVVEVQGEADDRVRSLENAVRALTDSHTQMQTALHHVFKLIPQLSSNGPSPGMAPSTIFTSSISPPQIWPPAGPGLVSNERNNVPERPKSPQNIASGKKGSVSVKKDKEDFPPLPGYVAPSSHRFGTYGIIPIPSAAPSAHHSPSSSRSSSSSRSPNEYPSALPHESLTAPIQALEALANAADQAAALEGGKEKRGEGSSDEDHTLRAKGKGKLRDDVGEERGRSKKRKRVAIDVTGKNVHLRLMKKTRPDPTPRNPFPDVITKGLVSETEARELWDIFFSGCHYFLPIFDKSYDTFETFVDRTPFSTNGLLAVAAKIRAGNGPPGQTFESCLAEGQGIARSTLFGPVVRKEAVLALVILSVWSQNGWLPCGHALRAGLDMNLHRALDRLAIKDEERSEFEERDLVVSARIWLNCYMHDHLVSLGNGKPLMLRDDSSVQRARELISHPMASETDMKLVASVELVNLRIKILEHLTPLHGKVDTSTITFVKSSFTSLRSWYDEWYSFHKQRGYDDECVLIKLMETERVYAEMWTVCVALRGCAWDKLSKEQQDLAFYARDSAWRCLEIFLRVDNFRKHLKYATHEQLVSVAFAAVFLLKVAILYPTSLSRPLLISQVTELAHLLSNECYAERYALTLRLMLANFRRSTGALSTVPGSPRLAGSASAAHVQGFGGLAMNTLGELDGGLNSLLELPAGTMGQNGNGLDGVSGMGQDVNGAAVGMGLEGDAGIWNMDSLDGFDWPIELSPSSIPVWLQDGNTTDLGLPADGSDSLFLPPELANMFLPTNNQQNHMYQFSMPDSGDVGAEAW
ncbi:hypothetical protein, variant [Cryptococcus amylolentus CBS 6039]|uniref:Zn(2)-C6 fungal-type domain-containing protein n=1 Tax=Cryptococcus amylolentus CBS 6039 TaxID=1295533 RepID=A0A1E3I8C0_9TREE|nr:hypothetical protein, variant [Cryptococcus amylolentus CBS 6039]ODN84061.1 hypothetical protein, variant [Cryptococcus amylolentus CBS 6039]